MSKLTFEQEKTIIAINHFLIRDLIIELNKKCTLPLFLKDYDNYSGIFVFKTRYQKEVLNTIYDYYFESVKHKIRFWCKKHKIKRDIKKIIIKHIHYDIAYHHFSLYDFSNGETIKE